jgi:23S rRNA G2445 N2-methylase RlmL
VKFYAACARGLEYLLVDELKALGAERAHPPAARGKIEGDGSGA